MPSAISTSRWTIRRRGLVKPTSLWVIVPFFIVMLVASLSVPMEQTIANGVVTSRNTCLPHVPEPMDQLHYVVDPNCDSSRRMDVTFCPTGLEPPWNEGQTITWYSYRVKDDCLELVGYDGLRDKSKRIINW